MSSDLDILQQINSVDLSKVETSFPILDSGLVRVNIAKAEWKQEESKKEPGKTNTYMEVQFSLAQSWRTVHHEGQISKAVNPGDRGSTFTERIYVGKYNDKNTGEEKWYGLDQVAKLRESVFGKAAEGSRIDLLELIGQQATVKLQFEPAPKNDKTGEVMGPRTKVASYIKKA